ncbi:hypothetical protein F5J12DRAFT_900942 [Pisolithus orientalis]|uniref:uncharacterized protein n=1 Tax=Pisolithus orientalis TaxID=936130 RepID=UPI002223F9A4|nr:uncharacterized protein F5J12DRAFT_900942 [Pisolithus orientalis]KAI5981151.1 hypothetical protein F5J12DRAFT_900942 [Pisolithus orientalis]
MSYAFNNFDLIQSHFTHVDEGSNMQMMSVGSQDDYIKCGCGTVIGAYDNTLEEVSPVGIGHVWQHEEPCNNKFVGEETACCGNHGSDVPTAMGPASVGQVQEWDIYSIVPQGCSYPQLGVDEVHGSEAGKKAGEPSCADMAHNWVPPTPSSPPNPCSSSSSSWWVDLSTLGLPSPALDAWHIPSPEVTEMNPPPPPTVAVEADQTGEPGATGIEIQVSPPPPLSSGTLESDGLDPWHIELCDLLEAYVQRSAYHLATKSFCPAVVKPRVDGDTQPQVLLKVLGKVVAVLAHPCWGSGGWLEESGRFP